MRFGNTAKVLAKHKLKYYRISECVVHDQAAMTALVSGSVPPTFLSFQRIPLLTPTLPQLKVQSSVNFDHMARQTHTSSAFHSG